MDYFDFEEASHANPQFDTDMMVSSGAVEYDQEIAQADLEAQRLQQPNPFTNTKAYGTTIKLKLINNREVEGILWDHNDGVQYPMFRAKEACDLCSRMGLDCFLASRGALITGCTCCISLYRECSFTHPQMPRGFIATFAGIAEDTQVCHGPMTEAKRTMRSFDDAKGRKSGSRFPRDAVKILKRWLQEHADHPYPSEKQKDELKQLTGLKRSQIANWLANARRRGKARLLSGTSSPMLGAVDIPKSDMEVFTDLNPLDRWKASPPENEPALMTDIARAIGTAPIPRNASNPSIHNSRASSRKASSEEDSNWSAFRAPSVSSFETRESSNSDLSFASSRSQQSRVSHASSQERRRRRRAPITQRTAIHATKARDARMFQCTFCTDAFSTKYDWARHEKSLHLALERWICCPNGGTVTLPDGRSTCVFCPELEPSAAHLETHNFMACHEKTMLERTFYRKDHLRQHLKLTHDAKFNQAMEKWKSMTNDIKSRCGFCPSLFTTWQQRTDHLAAHFRNGSDMAKWHGNWGFEPHVEKTVEHAIPPYLNGYERSSMDPYVARAHKSPIGNTPGLSHGTSADESDRLEPDQINLDSNCYHRIEEELTKYVLDQRSVGCIPTDQQLQDYARIAVYGDADPLDWTIADHPAWLNAFKFQMGIGPEPADVNMQSTACVPVMAPYVIRGGCKNKRAAGNASCSSADPNNIQPPVQKNANSYPALPEHESGADFDFETIDFSAFENLEFDSLGFDDGLNLLDPVTKPTDVGAQYVPAQSVQNVFEPFEMSMDAEYYPSVQDQQLANDQDLQELTKYMAGFPRLV